MSASMFKKILYGTIRHVRLPYGKIADMCRLGSTKTIMYRLGSTKFYYCFSFFAPGMYDTSYLNMQHLGAGHHYRYFGIAQVP